ncbi:MAG: hypothetical protein HY302_10530 [Opitutae bacterium]|nr:hypothetical protein [Opitutae bacterium]
MLPTIGRTVGYVLPVTHRRAGEIVPAVITRIFSEGSTTVQLTPFVDVANDEPVAAHDCSSVHYDEHAKTPRSWHWLARF